VYDPDRSITEFSRALELFTDRRENIRHFLEYLNEPARDTILFFPGDGGNGKTLLLNILKRKYCKRLPEKSWERAKHLWESSGEEFIKYTDKAETQSAVPSALVDFRNDAVEGERPKDAFYALLMIRRDLVASGLKAEFPLFDFACVTYLFKKRMLTGDRLKSLFPPETIDLVSSLADTISQTTYGSLAKAVLGLFQRRFSEKLMLYLSKRKVSESDIAEIERMDPDKELLRELPRLFAQDLNTALEADLAPERIVLFFDTHEAFWGHERSLPTEEFFIRDEWLRRLLKNLNRERGIVAVVGSRDRPLWQEATSYKIKDSLIDVQAVGFLPVADADDYLRRAGVDDEGIRASLIRYAEVEAGQVHPLLIGLCADIALEAKAKGIALNAGDFVPGALDDKEIDESRDDKARRLIGRLLLYVGDELSYTVYLLSACRSFDRNIYFELGEKLRFDATEPAFRELTRFSFVWKSGQRGEGWYRIHDLMRRLLCEMNDQDVRRADEVLEKYYRARAEQGDSSASVEAIYHLNWVDGAKGVAEWTGAFERALQHSHYRLCRALVELRSEMALRLDFERALLSGYSGDYFKTLSAHSAAMEEYQSAVIAYDRALALVPSDPHALNNRGNVVLRLGDLQTGLARTRAAERSYRDAIASFDRALALAPDAWHVHNNKGNALESLAGC
jgi:tetratricopeptide (TPR) repeat protein